MVPVKLRELARGVESGELIPYLGPGALRGVTDPSTGSPIPADSDSLILAMNNGKPMAPRLMWEFPRAAMDVELKRGRKAVHRFLDATYGDGNNWTRAAVHDWIESIRPPYVIDINRDTQLQDSYANVPHILIRGIARVGGTDYRFRIDQFDGIAYREVRQEDVDPTLPILFKPMGSPRPDPTYVASDADFVDYITELMGGFAVPGFLKRYRRNRRYVFLGLRLLRDTERMVLAEVIYAATIPAGHALIANPTDKERRFCEKKGIEIVEADVQDLLMAASFAGDDLGAVQNTGC